MDKILYLQNTTSMILIFPLIVHFLDQILLSECRQLMRNTLNNRANRSREFGAANRLFPRQNTSKVENLNIEKVNIFNVFKIYF